MSWQVTYFKNHTSNPHIEYDYMAHYDETNKHLDVYNIQKYKPKALLVDESDFNGIIKDPWYPISKAIKTISISTPTHITLFQRAGGPDAVSKPKFPSPFNAKKKRAVKSKSKSKYRRKSRSPRRV